MSDIKVLEAKNQYLYALCIAVRYEVFVIEQACPLNIECTPQEDDCHHYIALDKDDEAMGTARWRVYDTQTAKIERVATMKTARGKGVASKLMIKICDDIAAAGIYERIILGAQDEAIPFYQKLGFTVYGEGFMEAGIAHHMMEKMIKA